MLDSPKEYHAMAQAEGTHWWFRCLHFLVLRSIRSHFRSKDITILDAGCGTGGLMAYLKSEGYRNIRGFDLSEDGVNYCLQRGLEAIQGDVKEVEQQAPPGSIDVLVCNDVFTYLDPIDRKTFAQAAKTLLKPNGLLITNNAALTMFRGMHDMATGMVYRFNRSTMKKLFQGEGFNTKTARYWPFTLSPLIGMVRAYQRWKMGAKNEVPIQSDVYLLPGWLNAILYFITKTEILFNPLSLLGSSVFYTAVKKT